MKIVFNGQEREIDPEATVADLLDASGLGGKRIAIEVNLEIVPRGDFATRRLASDDRVEIVHAIGGG